MFQTIFHRGIRAGKADFHHSLPIQIAVRVFDLLDKITQPLFSRSRRVKPDTAALDKLAPVNGFGIDTLHCFDAYHDFSTS